MDAIDYSYDFVEFRAENDGDIFSILRSQGLSERFIKRVYLENQIKVNMKNPGLNGLVKAGDLIKIFYEDEEEVFSPIDNELDLIYEDENYLVINKPSGLVVHPTFSNPSGTLLDLVASYFKKNNIRRKVRFINRLDLETSGLILVAKNPIFHQQISLQMNAKKIQKKYLALVEGNIEKDGIVEERIARYEDFPMKRYVDISGEEAISKYKVLESNEDFSILELSPITGRTHQLRVHLAYIGHPILGDKLYGYPSNIIDRCALHSFSIKFYNPFKDEFISHKVDLAEDINIGIKKLF